MLTSFEEEGVGLNKHLLGMSVSEGNSESQAWKEGTPEVGFVMGATRGPSINPRGRRLISIKMTARGVVSSRRSGSDTSEKAYSSQGTEEGYGESVHRIPMMLRAREAAQMPPREP